MRIFPILIDSTRLTYFVLLRSSGGTSVSTPRTLAYQYPAPPSPAKAKIAIAEDFSYLPSIRDSCSSAESLSAHVSETPSSPPGQLIQVPSIPVTPHSLRSSPTTSPSRPYTYPSLDASHRGIVGLDSV